MPSLHLEPNRSGQGSGKAYPISCVFLSNIMNIWREIAVKNRYFSMVCSGFLLIFFIGGMLNHSSGFAGIEPDRHSVLWHGYQMTMCQIGIFAVISSQEIGYWWLLATFIPEILIEAQGTLMSVGGPLFSGQLLEVFLDIICLGCVMMTKPRYFGAAQ